VESASVCPKCGYARKETDTAPSWQCPSCGIAIEKYRALMDADHQLIAASIEAAKASDMAMRVAAASPITAALVREDPWLDVPPRLPLERRLAQASLDFAMAALFLWCWLAPAAWRPALASELGVLVLMEFFALHASIFLAAGSGTEGGTGAKLMVAFFVMLFYIPVAGAFAWWHGGWWPALGFAWLLASRVATMLSGKGSDAFEGKRARFYWGTAVGYYILFAFVVLVLPMPELGLNWKAKFEWSRYWNLKPQEVMAWGFFYFGALGLTKALEKPDWIAETE